MSSFAPALMSAALEQELSVKGFVVLPLLSEAEVEAIRSFYLETKPNTPAGGFHSTHFYRDRSYKQAVHDFLKGIFEPHIALHLPTYSPVFCNFMVKEPGADSRMPLHTDWTYVDESSCRSFALWCALSDTSAGNGALGVIPQSHLLPHNIRGPKIGTPFHNFNEALIENAGQLLEIPAGHAVIYDHRLMHYSPPNLSEKTRIALNVILLPLGVPIKHYCVLDNPEEIVSFDVHNDDFFVAYDAFEKPDFGRDRQIIPNPHFTFKRADLAGFLPENENPQDRHPWWKKWFAK
jgi:hypothetical protein